MSHMIVRSVGVTTRCIYSHEGSRVSTRHLVISHLAYSLCHGHTRSRDPRSSQGHSPLIICIHFGGCAGQLPPFEWGVLPLPGLSRHSCDGDLCNLHVSNYCYLLLRVDGGWWDGKTCFAPKRAASLHSLTELCHAVSQACALHTAWGRVPRGLPVPAQTAFIPVIASSRRGRGRARTCALAPCVNLV